MTYQSGGLVDDQDYNSLILRYNASFASTGGLGVGPKQEGEIVTRLDWYYLWESVKATAAAQGRIVLLPELPGYAGQNPFSAELIPTFNSLISALGPWGDVKDPPAPIKVGFTTPTVRGNEPAGASTSSGCPGNTDVKFPVGTTTITIPPYDVLKITVSGGGGAGALSNPTLRGGNPARGANGQSSSIPSLNMSATGGEGGIGHRNAFWDQYCLWNGSSGDTAKGGLGTGGQFNGNRSDSGVKDPNVGTGGAPTDYKADLVWGKNNIGGGGAMGGRGLVTTCPNNRAAAIGPSRYVGIGEGGDGGIAVRVWTRGEPGAPAPGTVIPVTIGAGGVGVNGVWAGVEGADQPGGYSGDGGFVRVETTCSSAAKFTERFSPGTHSFVVPEYTTMRLTLAGGGGGGQCQYFTETITYAGKAGGTSTFMGITANGGVGGIGPPYVIFGGPQAYSPPPPPGTASGGDSNTAGAGGFGGISAGPTEYEGVPNVLVRQYKGSDGAPGGLAIKQWNRGDAGAPVPGQTIQLVVGVFGDGGWRTLYSSPENRARADQFEYINENGLEIGLKIAAQLGSGLDGGEGFAVFEGTLVAAPPSPTNTTTQSTTPFVFKVGLDKASTSPVAVSYHTEGGVAGAAGSTTSFTKEFGPGVAQYTIPPYTVLNVEVGAGGGGTGSNNIDSPRVTAGPGLPGGDSSFLSLAALGGAGGQPGQAAAANGGASGGDVNTPGGGGRGGVGMTNLEYLDNQYQGSTKSGAGGAGGRTYKTWQASAAGAPAAGSNVTVTVGAAGWFRGHNAYLPENNGGTDFGVVFLDGAPGFVRISGSYTVAGATGSGNGLTATPDVDFASTSGTLTFAPGETYKEITVPVLYDGIVEPDETFAVILTSPVGATIDVGTATGTINGTTPTVPNAPPPPPPPPPPPDVPGKWMPYYVPNMDLPGAGFFWGTLYWSWIPTSTHPTADLPLPFWGASPWAPLNPGNTTRRYTQGEFGNSIGDNVNWPALQGKMSIGGDPYADPSQEIFMLPGY